MYPASNCSAFLQALGILLGTRESGSVMLPLSCFRHFGISGTPLSLVLGSFAEANLRGFVVG